MTLLHLDVISVPVTDQDVAKAFYTGVLGFEVAMDYQTGPDTRWVQLKLPNTQTSIALVTKKQTLPDGMMLGEPGSCQGITLTTDNIANLEATLKKSGSRAAIQSATWGQFIVFADPDGNRWLAHQAAA